MAIFNISGSIQSTFTLTGALDNAIQTDTDAILVIDLRPTTPKAIVKDGLGYVALGWSINDVVAVVTITGPQGVIYKNENYSSPDIVPVVSRDINKVIPLPLDPLTNYENILQGNYTLKVSWYNSVLDEYYSFIKTFNYSFTPPTIANTTVSGPYTGILKSTDITEYGNNVHDIVREHRVRYPGELAPVPADIVSTNAEIQVTPIYTNEWTITINSFVEYRKSDMLRIYWEGTGTFYHCVYGGCIGAMADAIETMLETYTDELACNLVSKEQYQHRLVTLNTAWHLLNAAYWSGDAAGADEQAYIIQEQVAYTGGGICGGSSSEQVVPCPPYTGGGTGGVYAFQNGLTEGAGVVVLGGVLTQNTSILASGYQLALSGSSGGSTALFTLDAGNVVASANDGSYGGEIDVAAGSVELKYRDLVTPANNITYTVGATGIIEAADYTALYTDRSLVSKSYVDSLTFGLSAVSSDASLTGNGTPASPLSVAVPFPGFTSLLDDYGYAEPTHAFSDLTSHPTTLGGYGITDAVTTFAGMTDTPAAYTGFAGYFVRVNGTQTGLEFVTGSWVASTGGTFTGPVTIQTSTDRPLVLRQTGAGSTPGVPEGGINYISFRDNDGDEQGYIGIDGSGNVILHSSVTGAGVLADDNLSVIGNVAVSGTLTVDAINEATSNNGISIEGVLVKDSEISLDHIGDPTQDNTISMAAHVLTWQFSNPFGGMLMQWQGAAQGHLFELQQTTGNPVAGTHLLHIEADHANVVLTHWEHGVATSVAAFFSVTGDVAHMARLRFLANGKMEWGDGTNVVDTNLYRSAANVLTTDDSLEVGGVLSVDEIGEFTPAAGVKVNGPVFMTGLTNGTDINVLYYDTVTGEVTYGATPAGGGASVAYGTKETGVDAGTQGDLAIDDDYLYVCTVGGAIGAAEWKKAALMQT